MKNQQLVQVVKASIWGYSGPHKWTVASDFVASLTDQQKKDFLSAHNALRNKVGPEAAMFEAAKKVGAKYSIAAALLVGPQKS
jgi:hypothetical protein